MLAATSEGSWAVLLGWTVSKNELVISGFHESTSSERKGLLLLLRYALVGIGIGPEWSFVVAAQQGSRHGLCHNSFNLFHHTLGFWAQNGVRSSLLVLVLDLASYLEGCLLVLGEGHEVLRLYSCLVLELVKVDAYRAQGGGHIPTCYALAFDGLDAAGCTILRPIDRTYQSVAMPGAGDHLLGWGWVSRASRDV